MEAPEAPPVFNTPKPKPFDLIYCPNCQNIPEIQIETKGKQILFSKICRCKPELEKSINDFIKILFDNREIKKICQNDNNHGIAQEFCTEYLKWYCPKCSLEHNSSGLNHITITSKEKKEKIELN